MSGGTHPASDESGIATPRTEGFVSAWSGARMSVRSYLNSFLSDRSAVDDLVQEVALLAWNEADLTTGPEAFLGFCLACAKRIAWNEIRKKQRRQLRLVSLELMSMVADRVSVIELSATGGPMDRLDALRECLAALGPGPRELLDLRYSTESADALREMALAKGLSLDAIYKKLERIRGTLRLCVRKKTQPTE